MLIRAFCILSVVGALATQATPASAQTFDLTGLWRSNTATEVYRIRQVDNRFYWIVDGTPQRGYANLFIGLISGNLIVGQWLDMPGSPRLDSRTVTLVLRIESNDRIVKVSETGSVYNGSVWMRTSGSTTETPNDGKPGEMVSWDTRPQFEGLNSGKYKIGDQIRYTCGPMPPGRPEGARVWGTGPYDSSSFTCDAAVHAGVITPQGGSFTVTITGPVGTLPGEVRNGVQSFPIGFPTRNSISFSR